MVAVDYGQSDSNGMFPVLLLEVHTGSASYEKQVDFIYMYTCVYMYLSRQFNISYPLVLNSHLWDLS